MKERTRELFPLFPLVGTPGADHYRPAGADCAYQPVVAAV
ncbi:hypothetical protein EcE24377A_3960 [Escherichia coli O139:H28 str. E24377A]|uniref:Uncharacterized protein n=1 Tax=Escherichia coli O139:H28 (strain E24377A / ETEC) TaxID=331111 RepID=A7ZT14_ECO24|nr:hypothetical protein EcE24377A_3960 [Escherichia coli O139:H28 str. E24377A]EST02707.1 hypothetical protein L341_0011 [Escherichia coli CE418]